MSGWDNYRFTLPLPTRANNLVRPALLKGDRPSARLVKTAVGKKWKAIAVDELQQMAINRIPMEGVVAVELTFWFATIASDIDGPVKSFLDACKGIVWNDDRQLGDLHLRKRILLIERPDPITGERVDVAITDASAWPEHRALLERLLAAKKRKTTRRASIGGKVLRTINGRIVGYEPAVYR